MKTYEVSFKYEAYKHYTVEAKDKDDAENGRENEVVHHQRTFAADEIKLRSLLHRADADREQRERATDVEGHRVLKAIVPHALET
jgi:hypothetical protein